MQSTGGRREGGGREEGGSECAREEAEGKLSVRKRLERTPNDPTNVILRTINKA